MSVAIAEYARWKAAIDQWSVAAIRVILENGVTGLQNIQKRIEWAKEAVQGIKDCYRPKPDSYRVGVYEPCNAGDYLLAGGLIVGGAGFAYGSALIAIGGFWTGPTGPVIFALGLAGQILGAATAGIGVWAIIECVRGTWRLRPR